MDGTGKLRSNQAIQSLFELGPHTLSVSTCEADFVAREFETKKGVLWPGPLRNYYVFQSWMDEKESKPLGRCLGLLRFDHLDFIFNCWKKNNTGSKNSNVRNQVYLQALSLYFPRPHPKHTSPYLDVFPPAFGLPMYLRWISVKYSNLISWQSGVFWIRH